MDGEAESSTITAIEAAERRAAGMARAIALRDAAAHLLRAFPPSAERDSAVSLFERVAEDAACIAAAEVKGEPTNG